MFEVGGGRGGGRFRFYGFSESCLRGRRIESDAPIQLPHPSLGSFDALPPPSFLLLVLLLLLLRRPSSSP